MPAITFTGLGDGVSWNDNLNWDSETEPVAGDEILIPTGFVGILGTSSGAMLSVTVEGASGFGAAASISATDFYFLDTSSNSGELTGNFQFSGSSTNEGILNGPATFEETAVNSGTVNGTFTCLDSAQNYEGTINGDATFSNFAVNENGNIAGVSTFYDNSRSIGSLGSISGGAFYHNTEFDCPSSWPVDIHDSAFIGVYAVAPGVTFFDLGSINSDVLVGISSINFNMAVAVYMLGVAIYDDSNMVAIRLANYADVSNSQVVFNDDASWAGTSLSDFHVPILFSGLARNNGYLSNTELTTYVGELGTGANDGPTLFTGSAACCLDGALYGGPHVFEAQAYFSGYQSCVGNFLFTASSYFKATDPLVEITGDMDFVNSQVDVGGEPFTVSGNVEARSGSTLRYCAPSGFVRLSGGSAVEAVDATNATYVEFADVASVQETFAGGVLPFSVPPADLRLPFADVLGTGLL